MEKTMVDRMIAETDAKPSTQMDEILHYPDFWALKSAWRGPQLLVDRANLRGNIKIEILSIPKQDLLDDLEDSLEAMQPDLYEHIYTAEYDQFGGQPVGAITTNYYMLPSPPDVKLMQYVSSVACMAYTSFATAAGPKFFSLESFTGLPDLRDLKGHFKDPQFAEWQGFRQSRDSHYVVLIVPCFLLYTPYDPKENLIKSLAYRETVASSHEHYLWGNTAYTFGTKLADSFAKYHWRPNIIGPRNGGTVENLPLHHFEGVGEIETKISTEVLMSDHHEYELAKEGFISLTMRKGSDNAAFFSASLVQRPKFFGISAEGKVTELNYRFGTQLPYMMIVNRLAHYLKVLQRERLGSWKERIDLELELSRWIRQYVADQEDLSAEACGRRPLRAAQIIVSDIEGEPDWYRINLNVRPHFKYMGTDLTLSLVGRLDKEQAELSMTGYGSLFGCLNGDVDKRVSWSREVSAMASVAAHPSKMFSARAGSTQTLSDYGLPDLNDMRLSLHDSLSQARSAIEGFIRAYEPRLSSVYVVSLPRDDGQLCLASSIRGLLEVEGLKRRVSFSACLNDNDQVGIS